MANFGGWSVEKECYDYIRSALPDGSTLLELGSGATTKLFTEFYTVYSIEHNIRFVDEYHSNYIYAPLVGNWYDVATVRDRLPLKYDCILIDGPPGDLSNNRIGFYNNIELFNTDVLMVFDDTNRKGEEELFDKVLSKIGDREIIKFRTFSVILPKSNDDITK